MDVFNKDEYHRKIYQKNQVLIRIVLCWGNAVVQKNCFELELACLQNNDSRQYQISAGLQINNAVYTYSAIVE